MYGGDHEAEAEQGKRTACIEDVIRRSPVKIKCCQCRTDQRYSGLARRPPRPLRAGGAMGQQRPRSAAVRGLRVAGTGDGEGDHAALACGWRRSAAGRLPRLRVAEHGIRRRGGQARATLSRLPPCRCLQRTGGQPFNGDREVPSPFCGDGTQANNVPHVISLR